MYRQGNIDQPFTYTKNGMRFGSVPLDIRFWAKVNKTKNCWLWTGSTNRGRGQINIDGKPAFASRVSWEMHNGPIPKGMKVLHTCDNPLCIRLKHLFLGTQLDNIRDCIKKGRKAVLTFEQRSTVLNRPEVKKKRSKYMSNTIWINNRKEGRRIHNSIPIPKGWVKGKRKTKKGNTND